MLTLNKANVTTALLLTMTIMVMALAGGLSETWFIITLGVVAGWCSFLAMGEAK